MESVASPNDRAAAGRALEDPCLVAVLDALDTVAPAGSLWEVSCDDERTTYSVARQDSALDHAAMLMVQSAVLSGVMRAATPGTGWGFDVHEGNTGLTVFRIDQDEWAVA